MRRRQVQAERPNPPPAPISVIWAMPEQMRALPGCCPKCGEHVGRKLREHTKTCGIDPRLLTA